MDLIAAQAFLQTHGYAIMFLIMVVEGPIITMAAAFAASLGLFNIWLIFLLSFVADVLGDVIHYIIGRFLKKSSVHKVTHFLGLSKGVRHLESQLHTRPIRTMALIKLIPPLTSAGLVLAGALRMRFEKFFLGSFIFTIPRTAFLVCVGFFFGLAASNMINYFSLGQTWFVIVILIIFVGYVLFNLLFKKVSKKMGY